MPSWPDGETSSEGPFSDEYYGEGGYTPDSIEDPTWCGIALDSTYVCCVHKEQPEKFVAYGGRNIGRRFLACAVENEVENCGFVEWIDEEWPDSLQYALHAVWSKLDEVNAARLEEQLKYAGEIENLAQEKKEVEKKYNDLKAEVNKTVDETVMKVQMANYYANLKVEEKDERNYEVCDKARIEAKAKVAQMVQENKKLKEEISALKELLKNQEELEKKREGEKEALKGDKKKAEYALYDLFQAHSATKEKLKKIRGILDE